MFKKLEKAKEVKNNKKAKDKAQESHKRKGWDKKSQERKTNEFKKHTHHLFI